ncbi:hypothetical protein SanaruYs_21970 [Chryseotalea sanaruensis]|uniref:DUF4440 domain-containing protein n=1 Tax=Chryseotalea sanaruensis TaxID=2482724 RepID=A0A401UAN0_9BACT|nr:nuclear transport factor 2 family protein [Chryseotalea sanaruensis]GCC51966.1 hypothetical protein SanaruYs_21970 [Chryseotalea sanaruensis]
MKMKMLLIALISLSACQKPSQQADKIVSEDDVKTLKDLKQVEWPKAYAQHDTILLNRILADDFLLIDADGNWFTKQDELDWIKTNATQNDSFYYEIKRLDILANGTAIVCDTGHIWKDSVLSTYQSSNILIKQDSIWKAVQSHVSGVKG